MTIVTGRAEGGGAKQPVCCGLIEPVKVGFDRGWGVVVVVMFPLGYYKVIPLGQGLLPCIHIRICTFTSAMQMRMQGNVPLNLA